MKKIYYTYENELYHIKCDGKVVHTTNNEYQRDMFIAELESKIRIEEKTKIKSCECNNEISTERKMGKRLELIKIILGQFDSAIKSGKNPVGLFLTTEQAEELEVPNAIRYCGLNVTLVPYGTYNRPRVVCIEDLEKHIEQDPFRPKEKTSFQYEEKFITINKKHLEKLPQELIDKFKKVLSEMEPHLPNNKYFVVNQDEPYAYEILQIIKEREESKSKENSNE